MIDREIKCRALDFEGNWHYGAYIYDSVHKKHFIISCGIHGLQEKSVRPETIGEYIGTIDGVQLYDGDVLKYTDVEGFGFESMAYSGIYVIKWRETDLRHDLYDPFSGEWWALNDTQFNSLVGNIYENPELLNGANS